MSYDLYSPFVSLSLHSRPNHWLAIFAAWMAFWAVVTVILLYAYAVLLPQVIGFNTTVLVGIGLMILSIGGGNE